MRNVCDNPDMNAEHMKAWMSDPLEELCLVYTQIQRSFSDFQRC